MPDPEGDRVLQYPTHAGLVDSSYPLAASARTGLDAIIVPASRPAENLQTAVKLANETGARLIALCSFRAQADEVRAMLAEHRLADSVVVEMPQGRGDWILPGFETTQWV